MFIPKDLVNKTYSADLIEGDFKISIKDIVFRQMKDSELWNCKVSMQFPAPYGVRDEVLFPSNLDTWMKGFKSALGKSNQEMSITDIIKEIKELKEFTIYVRFNKKDGKQYTNYYFTKPSAPKKAVTAKSLADIS